MQSGGAAPPAEAVRSHPGHRPRPEHDCGHIGGRRQHRRRDRRSRLLRDPNRQCLKEGEYTAVLPLQRLWSPFCTGKGIVTVVLGAGETEESKCVNCDGIGSLTCTTCQGSGIQPRYLDRREFKDDD